MVGAGSLAIAPRSGSAAELPNRKPNRHFRIKEVPESARKPIANQGVQDRDCFEMLAPLAAVQNVIECSNIAEIPLHLELVAVSTRAPNNALSSGRLGRQMQRAVRQKPH